MAVRQYVGARYVPKFADPVAWQANTAYEALTIVTYNNQSYTSKIPVPATVGNPADNSEYWVITGNYNAQVEDYRQTTLQVQEQANEIQSELAQEIADRKATDENIDGLINPQKRKYIFIGDSYNTELHHGGWGNGIINILGLTQGINVWNSGVGGAGFVVGTTFLSQLTNVTATLTQEQKNNITDIVVVGDINDWSASAETIYPAVQAFDNYVTNNYPNARYWLILGGWSYENDEIGAKAISNYNTIMESNKHARIFPYVWTMYLDPYFLETDMIHPTQSGMQQLTTAILNIINGGASWFKQYTDLQAGIDGVIVNGNITASGVHVWKHSSVGFRFDSNPITIPAPTANGVLIGTIRSTNNNLFERKAVFGCDCLYNKSDNTYVNGRAIMTITKNENEQTWNVYLNSNTIVTGESDYPVNNVVGVYPTFDVMLDFGHS